MFGTSGVFNTVAIPDPSWSLGDEVDVKLYEGSTCGAAATAPEINVKANNVDIADNDMSPRTADHTDFGSTAVSGGTVMRTFTIENTGNAALSLSGTPKVAVGGTNSSEFTVTQPSVSSVAAGSSTTFTVTFNPSDTGARRATLSIANNDASENPYNFAIQGTGTATTEPGFTVTPSTLTVAENGGTATFSVKLNTQPTAEVAVLLGPSDESVVKIKDPTLPPQTSLTFTTSNWGTAQSVTVVGVNDDVENHDGGREATIEMTTISSDSAYLVNTERDVVTVTVTDDDAVPPTTRSGGGTGAYQFLADECEATFLAADGTFSGKWSDDPDCETAYSSRNVSRFYWFTLPEGRSEVTFTLQGGGADAQLWLWPEWTNGHVGVGDAREPMRARFLTPGVHYLEVASGASDGRGEFRITMQGIGAGAAGLRCSDTLWTFTGSGSVQGRWDAGCATTSHYHREYNLVLDEPRIVTLDVTSPDADPILVLSTGTPLRTVARNEGSNRRSRLSQTLPAGTYHIDVDSKGTASAGSFTLNITFEPSVSCAETYRTITADGAIAGEWKPLCETAGRHERYYDLVVAQRSTVTLTLDSNDADPLLVLSRIGYTGGTAALTELARNDDLDGSTSRSRIVRTLDPGRYRVHARAKHAGAMGGFTLTVSGLGASASPSCADTFQTFSADHTLTGTWGPGCDRDRTADEQPYHVRSYDLVVEREETITLVLTSDDADPLLRLYGTGSTAGTLLASNDDDGSTSRSRIVHRFEPGRYRIEAATKRPEATGSFTLAVTEGTRIFGQWNHANDFPKYTISGGGKLEFVLESPEGPHHYSTDIFFEDSAGKETKDERSTGRSRRDGYMILTTVPRGTHTVEPRLSRMQQNELRNRVPIADRDFEYPIKFVLTVYEGFWRESRSPGGPVTDDSSAALRRILARGVSGPEGPDTAPTVTDTSQFKTHYFLVGQSVSLTLPAADEASGNGGPYDYLLWHKGAGKSFNDQAINGLRFDPLTRTLSGTPEAEGEWALSYVVHDGDGNRNAATDAFREKTNLKIVVEPDGQAVGGSPPQQSQSEPVNRAPSFDANVVTALELAENSPAGTSVGAPITATDPDAGDTLTYSLSGDDAASFSIDNAGQITTVAGVTYDYEVRSYLAEPSYSLTVTADDGNGGQISTPVTVSLTDVDDAPAENLAPAFHEGESTTRELAENSPAGTKVGKPVTAYDLNGDTLSYIALDGADGAAFAIDNAGQLTTVAGATYDYETKSSYTFMMIVMETDTAEGYLSGISVTVNLTDVDETQAEGDSGPQQSQSEPEPPANGEPSFDAGIVTTLEVAENSPAGTNVGSPITATDPDAGNTLTYSLSGTDAASFAIGSSTGQITTKSGVTYDYESKQSYSLSVDVSDGNGGTDSVAVTVNLTDVHEPSPPTASAGADFNGKRGEEVTLDGSGTAHAEGDQTLTYEWTVSDASDDELVTVGADFLTDADQAEATFTVMKRKHMTDRSTLDDDNWIEFTLTVTDGDGEQSTDTVKVTIQGTTWKKGQ